MPGDDAPTATLDPQEAAAVPRPETAPRPVWRCSACPARGRPFSKGLAVLELIAHAGRCPRRVDEEPDR